MKCSDACGVCQTSFDAKCVHPDRLVRRNKTVSVSLINTYEECHAKLGHRRVWKTPRIKGGTAGDFGNVLHDALEDLFHWVMKNEFVGYLPVDKACDFYMKAWTKWSMVGIALYQEGLEIIRRYVSQAPAVDHFKILHLEYPFEFYVDSIAVIGFIDRIDKVNDTTVRIIDYKSNRNTFDRYKVDHDLQMSIYGIAVLETMPWVKNVEYEFQMLRHRPVSTTRSVGQLDTARQYVRSIYEQMENDDRLEANLNENCPYCEFRMSCPEYVAAVEGKLEKVLVNKDDLSSIAKQREQMSRVASACYKRRRELDDVFLARVEEKGDLEFPEAGVRYTAVSEVKDTVYPLEKTVDAVSRLTGMSLDELAPKILGVVPYKLDQFLNGLQGSDMRSSVLLKTQIDGLATKISVPKLGVQPMKITRPIQSAKTETAPQAQSGKVSRKRKVVDDIDVLAVTQKATEEK